MSEWFRNLAAKVTTVLGTWQALVASILLVIVWAITGPLFNFSDTWQLLINTTTTVITFWMVFVIQNSSNRDARAVHVKLDEIIQSTDKARNAIITAESDTDEKLDELEHEQSEAAKN